MLLVPRYRYLRVDLLLAKLLYRIRFLNCVRTAVSSQTAGRGGSVEGVHRTAGNRLSSQSRRPISRAGEGHITDTKCATWPPQEPQHQSGAKPYRLDTKSLIIGGATSVNYRGVEEVLARKFLVTDNFSDPRDTPRAARAPTLKCAACVVFPSFCNTGTSRVL